MRLLISRSRDANCDFFMHVTRNGKVERHCPARSEESAEEGASDCRGNQTELYPNRSQIAITTLRVSITDRRDHCAHHNLTRGPAGCGTVSEAFLGRGT